LQTARNINGVSFNGTADITVTAAAGTLSGNTLASGVTASSLTSVGTLTSLTVSGNLTVDTNTLFVDAVNNRVGIGTTTPSASFDVTGASAIGSTVNSQVAIFGANNTTDKYITVKNSGGDLYLGSSGTSTYLWNVANTPLQFYTNNTERARIDTSGNLGLGVTPSAWASAAAGYSVLQIRNAAFYGISTNIARMSANAFVDSSGVNNYISNGFATRHDQVDGEFRWLTAASGTAGNAITFTQAMTLDASGNLGVGTASPAFGTGSGLEIERAGIATLRLENSSAGNNFELYADTTTNGINLKGLNTAPMVFWTGATERARITSAGSFVAGGSVALATSATDGFLYVPTCAGTPTGTPTAITGMAPIVVDTTNHKLYFYSSAQWRDAGP
jgi:hypothetical protein